MKIIIIGGGIGGLCAAVTLQKQGFIVQVFEANPILQPVGAGIGIGSNALQALMEIGVGEDVFANGHVLHKQIFQDTLGKTLNTIDFTVLKELYGQENITIHRAHLHRTFLDALKPDTLHLNKKSISIEQNDKQVIVYFEDGTTVTADLLIAADGIHSSIRQQLLPGSVPRYAGYTCWRGITENKGRVDDYTSSEYWSTQGRFGMAPMKNGLLYWFACINTEARNSQFQKLTSLEIGDFFAHLPEVVHNIITTTPLERILHHDISDIKPLRRFVFGRVVLLGDAAHATTPNMGQGAGQAIEDAIVLGNGFKKFEHVDKVLAFYEEKRVARTAKVIRLSRQIGATAQIQSRPIASVRDFLFPFIPSQLLMGQLKFLFDVKLK